MKLNPFMSNTRNSGAYGQFHVGSVGRLATLILAVSSFLSLTPKVSAQHKAMTSPQTSNNVNLNNRLGMSQTNDSASSVRPRLIRSSSISSLSDTIRYKTNCIIDNTFG